MVIATEIQHKINRIENIATLPTIATEILNMMRNTQASMRAIARIIEKDPSITTKILKVSNSPLWGFTGRVENVQRALVLLGLKQVTNIVIAVSLYSTFARLKPNPYFDREKFWLHSVGTGQIARSFSKKIKLNFQGEEFVASLIHDIGKMILDQFFPDVFEEIFKISRQSGQSIISLEKNFLGCTHAEIGAWLLEKWHFPPAIVTAVQYHHDPRRASQNADLASVVHISEILCELWGIGFDEDVKSVCLEDDPAWSILREKSPTLKGMDVERFTFELGKEMENAQLFIQLIRD